MELMTIEEVAAVLRLSPSGIRYQIDSRTEAGVLFAKIGHRRLARRADIEKYINERFSGAA